MPVKPEQREANRALVSRLRNILAMNEAIFGPDLV